MHYHDIDEVFNLKYGTADLYFGENLTKVTAPYTVNIPKDQIHGFRANTKHGFLLHETIDPKNFVSRAVIFVDMNKIWKSYLQQRIFFLTESIDFLLHFMYQIQ